MAQQVKNAPGKPPKKTLNVAYMRDKDREKVKGIFRFYEVPGGAMSFSFKAYDQDPVERYDLVDGEVYELPLGVAKHLNKNGWYPEYGYIPGDTGKTQMSYGISFGGNAPHMMRISKKIRRFGFQSLEFMDNDDLPSSQPVELVTVENIVM